MGLPVRTVCGACLQSLEVASGEEYVGVAVCPYCGCAVELGRPGSDAPTGDGFNSPPPDQSQAFTPRVDDSAKLPPGRIGRFVIRGPLGEGGYGQVFRAYDPQLDRDVALKVLKPNRLGEKSLERFYREARAAARLDHPNIVGLHDAGRDEGRCWIAYQLVSGRTLSLIRDMERPTVETTVRIVRDLALALEHAHGRGVFHRDLKPANVLIDDTGRARLTDFGLARRGDIDSDLTREGTVLGTPHYMSPEAAAGRAHEADGRSDVYSLGVILYELICGRRPADVPSGAPLWRSSRVTTPPTPRSVDRAIPAELDRICMKALAFDPEARYADARSLADALARYQHSRPASKLVRPAVVGRRKKPLALVAGVVGLCLVLALGAGVSLLRPATMPVGPKSLPTSASTTPALSLPPRQVEPSKVAAAPTQSSRPTVIRSVNSKTFHLAGCPTAEAIKESNRLVIPFPDEATIAAHLLKLCKTCNPTPEEAVRRQAKAR